MNWYYSIEGCAHGPVTERSLAELARSGTLGAGTLIWRPGLEAWEPVSKLKPEILGKLKEGAALGPAGEVTKVVPPPPGAQPAPAAAGFLKRIFKGRGNGRG